jgi:hypothetical protein
MIAALVVLAPLLTACESRMEIRVDRVTIESDARLHRDSIYGQRCVRALAELLSVEHHVNDLAKEIRSVREDASARAAKAKSKASELRQAGAAAVAPAPTEADIAKAEQTAEDLADDATTLGAEFETYISDLERSSAALRQQAKEVESLFQESQDAEDVALCVDLMLAKTSLVMVEQRRMLDRMHRELRQRQTRLLDTIKGSESWARIDAALRNLDIAIAEAGRALPLLADAQGYGGYRQLGVAEIDPSDPMYRRILGTETPVSVQPLTRQVVYVAGQSSSMVVQENPGQVRVYQISNNPTQIMQNIALISDKALAAAAKYLSPLPLP